MSHKVLLIGWDAADWKVINPLLDGGEMPNLERIAQFAFDLGARAPTINARIDPSLSSVNATFSPIPASAPRGRHNA